MADQVLGEMGWATKKNKHEMKAIENGSEEIMNSTMETYRKALASIEECLKMCDKVFDKLTECKPKLEEGGKSC